jgi:hypothetical protein
MQTFQDVAIVGTFPIILASKNDGVRHVITIEHNYFGLILSKMSFIKTINPTLNLSCILSIFKTQNSLSNLIVHDSNMNNRNRKIDRNNPTIWKLSFRLVKLNLQPYCNHN